MAVACAVKIDSKLHMGRYRNRAFTVTITVGRCARNSVDLLRIRASTLTLTPQKHWATHAAYHIHGVCSEERESPRSLRRTNSEVPKTSNVRFACWKGRKERKKREEGEDGEDAPNQDNFSATRHKSGWEVFCVMDGHGKDGHRVSTHLVKTLPYYLFRSRSFPHSMNDALREAFRLADEDLIFHAAKGNFDIQTSGSSSVVAVRNPGGTVLWSAWVGDCRLTLGSKDGVTFSTVDHRVDMREERERVEGMGATVIDGKVLRFGCLLEPTRAFGDKIFETSGVVAEPSIEGPIVTGPNYVMMLASDGILDSMILSDKHVKEVVDKIIEKLARGKTLEDVVDNLCNYAIQRWKEKIEENYRHTKRKLPANFHKTHYYDDLTVMLVSSGNICTMPEVYRNFPATPIHLFKFL